MAQFFGGMKPPPKQYRFHTPHQKQTGFIPGFIPRRGSLVSYPFSYLVSYLSRNKGIEAHGEPRRQERYLPNSCPENPCAVSYRFHTVFIPGFIPEPSRPSLSPIWLLCRPPFSYPGFIPWARGARFHTLVSYRFHTPGFIPRFHTGFIPVSYRFHTVPKKRAVSYPLNEFWATYTHELSYA